ncbi:apolipoprotein N-acyltransferase [Pseudorhodoferax sp. Leaf274]|uniref:apolipoprotein N-acyltransferase n=1 Tax=Pseudorhodoferax sp. Leaf274 TaxID=1736318 RepID=UPI000729DC8A|nr:apolipoprotein N-acyltransferase [Pseudorhodoferax sp. Leaf274]KQP48647.1 acyltransferase [Pseudorhodoferax sp. Leaf274]
MAGALVAGGAHALSIAAPWDGQPQWWLQLFALEVLVRLVDGAPSVRAAALRGFLFALAWLGGTFWWLFISLHVYGGLPAVLAVLSVAALAALLALYYALAAGVARHCKLQHPLARAALWAALWTLAELCRGQLFTGFPWGAAGYAHVGGPLAAFAPWVGVYGITAIAALSASLLASVAASAQGRWTAATGLLAVVLLSAGLGRVQPAADSAVIAQPLRVSLLQGNIPQDVKFEPGVGIEQSLQWYGQQLNLASTPLVVAPETALPLLPEQLPIGYWHALQARFASGGQTALIGMPMGDMRTGYINAAVGFAPGRNTHYEYAKHHLVPFGEFIPPLFRWFTEMMHIPLGDFRRGDVGQASMVLGAQRLAPNICYEDLFGEELAARFRDPATAPTIFVNMSNIAWFGDSIAIDQHLAISRMRALEFRRPMLRATNTGATAIVDAQGQVTHALPRLTRDVLTGEVHGRTDITPFAWWAGRFGLAPLWGLALATVALALWHGRRRQRP